MLKFREVFPNTHVVLPVIHVKNMEQAAENISIAQETGADGAFIIAHGSMAAINLIKIHQELCIHFPDFWIGANFLDLMLHEVFDMIPPEMPGVWVDNASLDNNDLSSAMIAQHIKELQMEKKWKGLYFGGFAFKYQRQPENLIKSAILATEFVDVITTSGPGTGQAASVEKIATIRSAVGDYFPIAIASGITPANVKDYMPHANCFLVATGINKEGDFYNLDPKKTKDLIDQVR